LAAGDDDPGIGRLGLPVGLQIVGPRFADARVLQLAWHADQVLGTASSSPLLLVSHAMSASCGDASSSCSATMPLDASYAFQGLRAGSTDCFKAAKF
jgi:hypothetical protein